MRVLGVFAVLLAFGLGHIPLAAQEDTRGPDRGPTTRVPGVDVLNLPNLPFSAVSNIEWTRVLQDGSTITLELHANLARDNQGRVYRENHSFVPAGSGKKAPLNEIQIYDPVARTHTSCDTRTLHCIVVSYKPYTAFKAPQEGASTDGLRYLQRENLGADQIAGMDVVGSRETVTLRANAVGNNAPLVTSREFWFSPQLQTNLAVTRDDPREGKQVIRLSDFAIGDPSPELFHIPQGYTTEDRTQAVNPSHVVGSVYLGKGTP